MGDDNSLDQLWRRIEDRFNAHDQRLDRLADVLDRMTRNEERLDAVRQLQATQAGELKTLIGKVSKMELENARRGVGYGVASKVVWAVAAAVIALVVGGLWAGGGLQ